MALDIDRYAHVDSPIKSWDARFKTAALVLLIIAIALVKTIPVAFAALVIGALTIGLSRLPLHFVSNGLSAIVFFLSFFFVVLPFSYPGQPVFTVLGVSFAWEGLRVATLIFVKALSIVLISFSMFGSSRFDVSMIALQRLRCPKILVQMILFTYRYTYVFMEEMGRMHTSMHARGFSPKADAQTLRIFGSFVGTLLVRSFERTDRVYKAMLSKGYQGELHTMARFEARPLDYFKALLVIAVAIVLFSMDHSGHFRGAEQGWF